MPDAPAKSLATRWTLHASNGPRDAMADLVLGDGIAGLANLDHDSETGEIQTQVDHVIADPPYEKEAHTRARRTRQRGGGPLSENYEIPFDPISEDERFRFGAAIRAACRGWSIIFCQVEAVGLWREAIGSDRYMRCCAWVKPDSTPQLSGDRPAQGFESFVCHWHGGGRSRWNARGKRGIYTHCTNENAGRANAQRGRPTGKEHPTQKPLALMRDIVQDFTREGDLVADPFAGAGTTGLACLMPDQYGIEAPRRFVGWEINAEYFETACRRLASRPRAVKDQEELFK